MLHRTAIVLLAFCAAVTAHAQVSPSMDSPMTPNGLPEQSGSHRRAQSDQDTSSGSATGQAAQPTQSNDDSQEATPTIRVGTNIVHLYFNVRDKENQLVTNLEKGDCTVQDNGQDRPIKTFELVKDQPLTLGVLVDTSGSQSRLLPIEKESGARFLREVLRPATDEAFVMSFDIHVDLVEDFTPDIARLKRALNSVEINTGTGSGDFIPDMRRQRGTLLYDAVYLAANEKFNSEAGRHAMVLLTDGQDEGSQVKIKEAIEAAQRSDATVYVILLYDPAAYGGTFGGYAGDHDVKRLTDATGGRVYVVGHDGRKLEATFDLLSDALHKQYAITFNPSALDGKFHPLNVQCKAGTLKVDARKGYFAVPETAPR